MELIKVALEASALILLIVLFVTMGIIVMMVLLQLISDAYYTVRDFIKKRRK